MKKTFLSFFGFCWLFANSQDSLPDFSVINKGNNRIVISWNNTYKITRQITIQRSEDSLTNFRSIVSVPDPMNKQNGYLDTKAPDDKMFYRLYIHIDGSYFLYSKSKRPLPDGFVPPKIIVPEKNNEQIITAPAVDSNLIKVLNKISTPQIAESVYTSEEVLLLQKYKNNKLIKIPDSISRKIDVVLKLKSRPELILPMYRIVSNKDGLVQVNLNDFLEKKYTIRFYEEDSSFLFELKNIKEASFLLDKSNFHHAGWFKSELYDNGKLIETNRFFISKDF
jgi:hypothetical protein